MQRITGRCALHYGVTLSLFCLYGWQVCPFLESLTLPQLLGPTLVTFAIMFAVRNWLLSRRPLARNGLDGFGLEVGFYLLGALLLSGYNALAHDFPLESHLKVLLGMTTLGFLVAADLTLERDWNRARTRQAEQSLALSHPLAMPLPRKFTLFTLATLTLLGASSSCCSTRIWSGW